ncbi:MarR family winged helix-turn-helix transcriptional regulator [Millisia brevis]|uniref:MarR family winged helix-turn-helix transcriptional regulator n=1 Tax=Millisia brevis TaxID=264148 RepID=UPI00082963BD|nr:MarR family transcriptional regulator [Millisia brevis]
MTDVPVPSTGDRPTAVPPDPLIHRPGFVLWHLTAIWQRRTSAALAPLGLTHTQFIVLSTLAWLASTSGPCSQIDIARRAGIEPQLASQVLRKLEAAELISRTPHPTDTRARLVAPTDFGHDTVIAAVAAVDAAEDAYFAELPAGFREAVLRCGPSLPAFVETYPR